MARVPAGFPPGKVVVLSPHLDDAVFSLGASIARAARRGSVVRILTVLAGDPESVVPAGYWDALCGFATAGHAARDRRAEDRRACRAVGAEPAWLPYGDEQYQRGDEEEIWDAIVAALDGAGAVLAPGFPLTHVDHAWLGAFCLARRDRLPRLGLYLEQPYTWHRSVLPNAVPEPLRPWIGEVPDWRRIPAGPPALLAKAVAALSYDSQARAFGRRHLLRLIGHEAKHGGESVAWLDA